MLEACTFSLGSLRDACQVTDARVQGVRGKPSYQAGAVSYEAATLQLLSVCLPPAQAPEMHQPLP